MHEVTECVPFIIFLQSQGRQGCKISSGAVRNACLGKVYARREYVGA